MAIIPVSDNPGPRRRFPFVNYALILANIAVFGYEVAQGSTFSDCFTSAYALVPYDIVHGVVVQPTCAALPAPHPIYLTLITAMFLHASLLHIGGNMIYLWVFGDNVEDRLGHVWYLVFYLFCGFVAFATQIAFSIYANQATVLNLGASGAIAGVLGAYLVFYPASRVRSIIFIGIFFTLARLSAVLVIGFFIALQVFEAYVAVTEITQHVAVSTGGVAFFAHIGGFCIGLIIALLVKLFGRRPSAPVSYPNWPLPK